MKKLLILVVALITIISLALAGCGKTTASDKVTSKELPEIIGINWQWIEADSSDGNPIIVVNGPAKYMLVFKKDYTFEIISDCNSGSGKYIMKDSNLSLILGPMTTVACGEESLSDQYIPYLNKVVSFAIKDGKLYLNLKADEGDMVFVNGG